MSTVALSVEGSIAQIMLSRPDALNALDLATRRALLQALARAAVDPHVRAVILTGSGRAFCSGQDLAAGDELVDAGATVADTYNPLIRAITAMDKPVIAAVNGLAVGAGMGLALACDLVLMAQDAFFSCAFVRVGLVPDSGITSVLVRRLGHTRAFALAASARRVGADEALTLGLISEVVADDELQSAARERAAELASGPGYALALTKRLLRLAAGEPPDRMLDLEARAQGAAAATSEHAEGVAAFLERRAPAYPVLDPPEPDLLDR
jgi:2-(1,2-epoxy-1,2-dihydrophenyl)acetyl-CoA isomerase